MNKTSFSLTNIALHWYNYKKYMRSNESIFADIGLKLLNRELEYLARHTKGCLTRAIKYISANVDKYEEGKELLQHILNYSDRNSLLSNSFHKIFKRNTKA